MPALCLILNSAYYAYNYAGTFDAGLLCMQQAEWLHFMLNKQVD